MRCEQPAARDAPGGKKRRLLGGQSGDISGRRMSLLMRGMSGKKFNEKS
jgi:hypothetical protein